MAKLQVGQVMDITTLSKLEAKVGTIVESLLTIEQFEEENLGQWKLMDGTSCVGTLYHTITGNTVVPNATTEGTFLRQAKAGRTLGSFEADENKSHNHSITLSARTGGIDGSLQGPYWSSEHIHEGYRTATATDSGSDEARPKNLAVNFFIKVGY